MSLQGGNDPRPFDDALFIDRPNRFVVLAQHEGRTVRCHLPNPGRLSELLFPGVPLKISPREGGATEATVQAVESNGEFVPLHTSRANDAVASLLAHDAIQPFVGWKVAGREVRHGNSRFDFLLERDGVKTFLEVKCCSLFAGGGAYFPDAPSQRATKHLTELADLTSGGTRAAVVVLAVSNRPEWFAPHWHTDPVFSQTLLSLRGVLPLYPVAAPWLQVLPSTCRPLPVPWNFLSKITSGTGGCLLATFTLGETPYWAVQFDAALDRLAGRWRRSGPPRPPSLPDGRPAKLRLETLRDSELSARQVAETLAPLSDRVEETPNGIVGTLRAPARWNRQFEEALLSLQFGWHEEEIKSELGLK